MDYKALQVNLVQMPLSIAVAYSSPDCHHCTLPRFQTHSNA